MFFKKILYFIEKMKKYFSTGEMTPALYCYNLE